MRVSYLQTILVSLACRVSAQAEFSTTNFKGALADGSQVLESLRPASNPDFDFSPSDVFSLRNSEGNYHTGDLTFRYRVGSQAWQDGNTAASRTPVEKINAQDVIAAANLNPVLSEPSSTLDTTREWIDVDGDLGLRFTLSNVANDDVEIGSLGFPIEFNNIFTNRSAVDTREKCVLLDPYIGLHSGYVQATRLSGTGPALVVTPLTDQTKFEAWRFLPEEYGFVYYQSQTYEGNYEWQVYTKAWAENEWSGVDPWNEPTSVTLKSGENITVGLRFSLAPSIPEIEDTVIGVDQPVAVGIPGYVLPTDVVGKLFLHTNWTVSSLTTTPADAFEISEPRSLDGAAEYSLTPSKSAWGRVRLDIKYENGKTQTVHYRITKPAPEVIKDLGNFLTTKQLFEDESDPFGRAHSIITYDRSVDEIVTQDARVWMAGISDEGGAGSWLAAAMKQSEQPSKSEISTLETFVSEVVNGTLQVSDYGVRKSVFFYDPEQIDYAYSSDIDWTSWTSWNKEAAYAVDRAYDYVHVTALYWSLYRAGRAYPELLTQQNATYYLLQAYHTVTYMAEANGVGYRDVGLMGETVFGELLKDLGAEGYETEATKLKGDMQQRAELWASQDDPFGSEQAWDSTGQEGVYYWANYFGDTELAKSAVSSIMGYMPTVAHWGWNGNGRRYWDFIYGAKLQRIERQIHHYGSGLNSLPLLSQFRNEPSNFYLLRVGYGGNQGPLTNIDEEGFASAAFHSYPDTLKWDDYSGDYGPNFLGHALGAATYIVQHDVYGWLSFGGNVISSDDGTVTVKPLDSARRRVFVAPVGLYVSIDAGVIDTVTYATASNKVTVSVAQGDVAAESALVKFEQTADGVGSINFTTTGLEQQRGGWVLPLGSESAKVEFAPA
ncbi:uncharacterized protein K452DRAFT_276271 [Aplosporella prunicola CBS 121167]|uniref:Glycoside hydrolase family 43 protein n=1 Tax=Aplosporella prunicola CBS 121167 TaxID=1176127 RepID=A0A6A6B5Q7_9PEZI|nr:uncharacterized protein K452DRAFT_276271 [Aplosporella prunicola CBS 121167]KAF2139196.1 hypothetical protein K452DRAFT_276271 [Aplosporella prunicola CBS 121167]